MRKIIALDIDGVVANFISPFTKLCEAYGISINDNKYDFVCDCNEKEKQIAAEFINHLLSNQYLIKPYFNVNNQVQNLYKHFDILFITARRKEFEIATRDWLNYTICQTIPYILIMDIKSEYKVKYLLNNKINIFVEDRLRTANEAARKGIKIFLKRHTWNSGRIINKDIIVIKSLDDILKYF